MGNSSTAVVVIIINVGYYPLALHAYSVWGLHSTNSIDDVLKTEATGCLRLLLLLLLFATSFLTSLTFDDNTNPATILLQAESMHKHSSRNVCSKIERFYHEAGKGAFFVLKHTNCTIIVERDTEIKQDE